MADRPIITLMSRRRHPRYHYIATNGRVTIWHQTPKRLNSAIIRESTYHWRAARPSGDASYPAIRLSAEQYVAVLKLWVHVRGPFPWLDNSMLSDEVRALLDQPLPQSVPAGWDVIEADEEVV